MTKEEHALPLLATAWLAKALATLYPPHPLALLASIAPAVIAGWQDASTRRIDAWLLYLWVFLAGYSSPVDPRVYAVLTALATLLAVYLKFPAGDVASAIALATLGPLHFLNASILATALSIAYARVTKDEKVVPFTAFATTVYAVTVVAVFLVL